MNQRGQFLYSACVSLAKLPDHLLRIEAIRLSQLAADDCEATDESLLDAIRSAIEQHLPS